MSTQTLNLAEAAFKGIDQYNAAVQIRSPLSQVMDNLNIQGGDDDGIGIAELREGKQGLLAAALPNAIYLLDTYTDSAGATNLLFTSNGRLYRMNPATDTAATEITLSGGSASLASSATYATRAGNYEYFVDSVGALKRSDLSAVSPTASLVNLMSAPATPTVTLASTLIDATTNAGVWTGYGNSIFSELIVNGSFETGVANGPNKQYPSPAWVNDAQDPDAFNATASGGVMTPFDGTWALLLDQNDKTSQLISTLPTVTLTPLTPATCRVYLLSLYVRQADTTGRSSVIVQVQGLDSVNSVLSVVQQEITQVYDANPAAWIQYKIPVSFTDPVNDSLSKIKVSLWAGAANQNGAASTYVDLVSLRPVPIYLAPSISTTNALTASVSAVVNGISETTLFPKVGGQFLRRTFTSTVNFAQYNIISMQVSLPTTTHEGGVGGRPRFRFGFATATDTAVSWTNPCTYSTDGTFISVDCSTLSAAVGGARQACKYFFVQIMDDIDAGAASTIFSVKDITAAGNLSVGYAPYIWALVECDTTTDATVLINIVESAQSGFSASLIPSLQQASANITLGARSNSGSTYWKLYRAGGTFADGFFRLVAMESWSQTTFTFGADVPKGLSPYYAAPANPYTSFTYAGSVGGAGNVLYDSTPDSFLTNAETLSLGREAAPTGATSICEWGGRLWLSVGRFVYGSHLLGGNKSAGVYFSTVTLPTAPNFSTMGVRFSVGGDDTDPVVRLIVLHDRLIALRKRGHPYVIMGTSPLDFSQRPDQSGTATGCVAPRGAIVWKGLLIYMGPSGLMAYNGVTAVKFSLLLQKLLVPQLSGSGAALLPAAVAQCALFTHNENLYLAAPSIAADTTPTCLFNLNGAENGWTRYPSMTVTSGASALSDVDKYTLFVAETGGQISKLVPGVGDKALSGSAATSKTFTLTTRAMGQESHNAEVAGRQKVGTRFFGEFENGAEAVTLTITVTNGDNGSARVITYTLPASGGVTQMNKGINGVRGRTLIISVTGAASLPFNIRRLGVESVVGGF